MGNGEIKTQFTSKADGKCVHTTCIMCVTKETTQQIQLNAGPNTITVKTTTQDGWYHQDAYFRVRVQEASCDVDCSGCELSGGLIEVSASFDEPDIIFVPTVDDDLFPPIGPAECPYDILLLKHNGVTTYPENSIRILSQDETTVTVELLQLFTPAPTDVPEFAISAGATCESGYSPITSNWEDCKAAAVALGFSGDSVGFVDYMTQEFNFLVTGLRGALKVRMVVVCILTMVRVHQVLMVTASFARIQLLVSLTVLIISFINTMPMFLITNVTKKIMWSEVKVLQRLLFNVLAPHKLLSWNCGLLMMVPRVS